MALRNTPTKIDQRTAGAIGVMIAKLSAHYFRPDFGPEQVKHMLHDFVEDLGEFPTAEVEVAFTAYRRNPENRFFPTPGMIRGLLLGARKERAETAKISTKPLPKESRPILWHAQAKQLWKSHWKESEVPMGEKIHDTIGGPWREPERVVF